MNKKRRSKRRAGVPLLARKQRCTASDEAVARGSPRSTRVTAPRRRVLAIAAAGAALVVLVSLGALWRSGGTSPDSADSVGPLPERPSPRDPAVQTLLDEATRTAQRLAERFPNRPDALSVKAQLEHRLGNAAEAAELWEKCLQLDSGFLDAYIELGSVHVERGEYDKAEAALRKALALAPGSPRASTLLAHALMNQGQMEETVAVLHDSVAGGTAGMPSFLLLGQAYLQLKRYEQAKQCFESAVSMAPELANAHYGLATACARLGQREESARHMATFESLDARDLSDRVDQAKAKDDEASARRIAAETCLAAGTVYYGYGDPAQAESHWLRAEALDPENAVSRQKLVRLYTEQKRPRDALAVLQRLEGTPAADAAYWTYVGTLHRDLDEFDAAEKAFRRAIAASEKNGDVAGALRAVEEALKLDPGNAEYLETYRSLREKAQSVQEKR